MDVFDQLEPAPRKDVFDEVSSSPAQPDVFDQVESPLSGRISGSDQAPPPEIPTLSAQDPRFPEVAQAVGTGLQTAQAIARPFQVDLSTVVPGEERGRQLKAVEIERTLAQDAVHQLSGVHPATVGERVQAAQNLSALMRKERGLRAIQADLHAQSPEGQREALANVMGPLYEKFHGSTEGGAPGLAATGFAKVAEGVLGMSAAAGESLGMSEAAQAMRADMAGFERVAQQTKGHAADVVRGLAGIVPLVVGLPEGKAGAVQAATRAAAQAYSSTLDKTGDTTAAYDAAVQTAPEMAAFMLGGAAAGKGVAAMLPKDARAMTAGLANFAGSEMANVGVSNVLAALHGQDYGLSNFSADTLFALYHGIGGYEGRVTELERQRAAEKLKSYGWSEQQINAPYDGPAETPSFEIIKPIEETSNAQQIIETSAPNGGVRSRSEVSVVPPEESSPGIQPGGQGEGLVEPARGEAPQEVTVHDIVPAIRAGEEVIRGKQGEEHQDILNRLKENDVEKFLSALDTFGKDNLFVDTNGKEYSRDQLKEKFGVSDSQGLRDLQASTPVPARNLGPGAANIEEAAPQVAIGAKNASVDAQRAERGLPPLMSEAAKTDQTTWSNVEKRIESDPEYPARVVNEIESGNRKSITDEDQTALLWRMVDLRNQRDLADQRALDEKTYSPEEREAFTEQANGIERELQRTEEADRKIGTASGRALRIRQLMANEDFTLAAMERRARTAKGDALTPEERTKVKQQADEIAATQKAFEERTAKLEEEEAGKALDESIRDIETEASKNPEFTPEVKSLADRIVARLDKFAESALTRLRGKLGQANVGADPTILADAIIYGSAKIGKGLIKFGKWATEMVKDLGEGIKPYLEDAWKGANKNIDDQIAGTKTKKPKEVRAAVTKENAVATAEEIGTQMKAKGGKLPELRGDIQNLVKTLVRGGMKDREAIVDAVHEVLKEVDPAITRRETMDAISGYGDFKQLNKGEVESQVRDIKQQLQLVAKIQDVQARVPLAKSGVERQKLSDESRRLTAELNENIKKFGIEVTDPETQLRTILASQETRLTNRIKDLRAEIASGERRVQTRTEPPSNEKIAALKKELASVESEHEKVFGKRQQTPEQKLAAAVAGAKRAEASEQAKLEKVRKGIFDRPIKNPKVRSAELDAIKARVDAAREERKALEEAANPPLSDAQKRLDAAMVERERMDQLLAGEIAPAKKLPKEALTDLEHDVRAEIAAMRELAAEQRRSDPQAKENSQVKALEKAAAEYERRLNEADFTAAGKKLGPDTARVAKARALRDAAKAALEAARKLAHPPRTKEQIRLQNYKALAARKIADLQDRLAKGDFTKKPRKELDISKDPEAVRLKAENDRLKREFEKARFEDEQRKRSTLRKGIDAVKETLAASRSLITSADVSAPLRQGGFLLIGDLFFHPVRVAKQLGTMFHQLVSEKGFQRAQAAIGLRPNADLYQQSKLYLSDMDSKLNAREENMRSNLAEELRIPWLGRKTSHIPILRLLTEPGRIVRASNRAYTGFLNRQRVDSFDAMVEARGGKGAVTPEGAKLLAEAVNTLTGRGSIGATNEGAANFLAKYLFSPRFLASRFQTVLGKPILGALGKGASARDRAIIAKQYVKFAAGVAAIYGLAQLAGAKIEKDPRSSDFGKLRFGATRVDPLAGLAQVTTLMARTATGKTKTQGEIKPVTGDTYYQFARSKLAPVPGALLDLRTGKNVVGEKVTPGGVVQNLTVPLSYQDMGKVYKDQGGLAGTVINVLNLLGAGVQTYKR